MANPYYALHRIRRARRALPTPPEPKFESTREQYRAILEEVHDLAGEDAVDDVSGWIIVEAAHDGALPSPAAARERATSLLTVYGVEAPEDSILGD